MSYQENKQEAFMDAQASAQQAKKDNADIVRDSASYGTQLSHLKQEINEAFEQIENALEVASEHQKSRLQQYQQDLQGITAEWNETE